MTFVPSVLSHVLLCTVAYSHVQYYAGQKQVSDIPHDRRHGLNQSATRLSGHDFTIMPAYCVACRTRAITPSYAGNKQCLGPAYDRVIARIRHIRQYDETHTEHNSYVRYVKRVVIVCRTVQLMRSFPHLGRLWLGSCSMTTPRKWTRRR